MDQLLPGGYRLRRVEETTSTNTDCVNAALAGDAGRLWIVARRQTSARGSRGRSWTSYEGNLFASLLLREIVPPSILMQLTFVTAVAVREALDLLAAEYGVSPAVELKWPNDVLLDGCKVSGILLESHEKSGARFVVIGIGVNCCSHPHGTTHPATDLASRGIRVNSRETFDRIAVSMDRWIGIWNSGEGFREVRAAWLKSARGVGSEIVVMLPGGERFGTFEDIDETGRLLLRAPDGARERISTADIFILDMEQNASRG